MEALTVLGRRLVTDRSVAEAFDVLGLVALQRERVADLLRSAESRLERLAGRAGLAESVDDGPRGVPRRAPGAGAGGPAGGIYLRWRRRGATGERA